MKVIVCGGHDYWDGETVRCALDYLRPSEIAQGGADGADYLARWWAWARNVPCRTYPADWRKHGRYMAGRARNEGMWFRERPDATIAFPGGPGTEHMKSITRREAGWLYEVPAGFSGESKLPAPKE